MGKFKSIFKRFLGFEEEEEETDFEDLYVKTNLEEDLMQQKGMHQEEPLDSHIRPKEEPQIRRTASKLEQVYHEIGEERVNNQIILHPKSFGDACVVADKIADGYTVIMDLEDLDLATCKRIADFVLGAVYIMDGDVEKISAKVFRFWL